MSPRLSLPVARTDVAGTTVSSPAPRDVWRRVADSDPDVLVSQTPQWMDAVVEVGGWRDASRWYVAPDGRDLILPMARRGPGGSRAVQFSYGEAWGFGGLLAEGGVKAGDVAMVLQDLGGQRSVKTAIRINPLQAELWAEAAPPSVLAQPRSAHVLDLRGGADEVWSNRLTSKARGGVRRARKLGVEVERDTTGDLLPLFHKMLFQSIERWAGKQHEPLWMAQLRGNRRDPLRKFQVIADRIGGAFRLYVARHEGRPAAAIVVLAGTNAHWTRSAMDVSIVGNTKSNELLLWTAIEDACRSGCSVFQMGETAPGSSLARYKEKYGAVAVPYAQYVLERLPITRIDTALRTVVKRAIGFRDA